jgi:hypothetical protein
MEAIMRFSPYQEDPLLRHSINLLIEVQPMGQIKFNNLLLFIKYLYFSKKKIVKKIDHFFEKIVDFLQNFRKKILKNYQKATK